MVPLTRVVSCSLPSHRRWHAQQSTPWHLDDPRTYRTSTTHWVDAEAVQARFGVNFRRNVGAKRRSKRRASVSDGMVIEAALFSARRWTVPEPGQVWVRIRRSGDMRQRRDAALHQRLPDPCGYALTCVVVVVAQAVQAWVLCALAA